MRLSAVLVALLALVGAASASTINVTGFGVDGWMSDDTRSATGANLVGTNYTHYGKPGQAGTAADDAAIADAIQFVDTAPGGQNGLRLEKNSTSPGMGKTSLSKINTDGFAWASGWLDGFYANYNYYTNTTAETAVLKIGIQSSLWDQSQAGFTAQRSGESAWDFVLVHWLATPTANKWVDVSLEGDTDAWYVYKQAGNGFYNNLTGTKVSLFDLYNNTNVAKTVGTTNYTWQDVLFGKDAKVTSIQLGVGSSAGNSVSYIGHLDTSLLDGDRQFGRAPEPATIALLGAAGLAGGILRKRRAR